MSLDHFACALRRAPVETAEERLLLVYLANDCAPEGQLGEPHWASYAPLMGVSTAEVVDVAERLRRRGLLSYDGRRWHLLDPMEDDSGTYPHPEA